MNYIDIDFPEDLISCFSGGPEFVTTIAESKSKKESRNQIWNTPRYKYNLTHKICSNKTYRQLQAFFLICKGKSTAFNFLDRNDYKIEHQEIGIGDGKNTQFQIYKTYFYKNYSIKRQIYKVKDAKIFINNQQISENKFSIINGFLSFSDESIPEPNSIIIIDATFYVIVRFEIDFLPVVRKSQTIELPDISLIETQI